VLVNPSHVTSFLQQNQNYRNRTKTTHPHRSKVIPTKHRREPVCLQRHHRIHRPYRCSETKDHQKQSRQFETFLISIQSTIQVFFIGQFCQDKSKYAVATHEYDLTDQKERYIQKSSFTSDQSIVVRAIRIG